MSKNRLETFCDGVFAIAITLLVLDLRVPEVGTGSLADALWHEWPSVVAFVVSFMLIGIMWVNHHTLMRHFEFVDRAFLFINLAFLMVVAFVPFPTGVVAESLKAPRTDANLTTAALFYGLTSLVLALMFNAVWHYGRLRLMSESADPAEASGITRTYTVAPVLFVLAILLAFVNPYASLAMYALLAATFILNSSLFARS